MSGWIGAFAEALAIEECPNLVLVDLMMPVMDGFDFIHAVRGEADWRQDPIVVVSAKELTPEEHEFLERSSQRLLSKGTVSLDTVLGEISDVVRGAPREEDH